MIPFFVWGNKGIVFKCYYLPRRFTLILPSEWCMRTCVCLRKEINREEYIFQNVLNSSFLILHPSKALSHIEGRGLIFFNFKSIYITFQFPSNFLLHLFLIFPTLSRYAHNRISLLSPATPLCVHVNKSPLRWLLSCTTFTLFFILNSFFSDLMTIYRLLMMTEIHIRHRVRENELSKQFSCLLFSISLSFALGKFPLSFSLFRENHLAKFVRSERNFLLFFTLEFVNTSVFEIMLSSSHVRWL